MAKLEWIQDYSVGVETFDSQHKRLFELINELVVQESGEDGHERLCRTLDTLSDYMDQHFKDEEEMMAKHSYPNFEEHREEHTKFVRKNLRFYTKLKEDSEALTDEVTQFLGDWWIHHIMNSDRQYKRF